MSEVGELYSAIRKDRQTENQKRLRKNTMELLYRGIPYLIYNEGLQLRIRTRYGYVDFWPSTGRWIKSNNRGVKERGIESLVKHLKQDGLHGDCDLDYTRGDTP